MTLQKTRVALLTFEFAPFHGGVQTYLYEITKRLAGYFNVTIITSDNQEMPEDLKHITVQIPNRSPAQFRKALRTNTYERILIGHCHPILFLSVIPLKHFSAIAHGNDFLAAQSHWHHPIFNLLIRKAHPLITNSRATAKKLRQLNLHPKKIIYPGTDPDFFTPSSKPSNRPILLSVGRLVPRKGLDTAISAIKNLAPRYPTIEYWIAGTGPDRERLQNLAIQEGVAEYVRFLGRVPQSELPGLYQQAAIFLLPVREEINAHSMEGFGIVFLEASASGLPVIAGRSGGAVEAVQDGITGLLIHPNDPQAVEMAVRRLFDHPEERRSMGRRGRKWVEDSMNWDRAAREMAEALAS